MQDIIKYNKNNPGNCSIEVIPINFVNTMPPSFFGKITSPIVLESGKNWIKIYSSTKNIDYKSQEKTNKAGNYFKTKLDLEVPKDNPETLFTLLEMQLHKFIVKIQQKNSTIKILGTANEPLQFQFDTIVKDKKNYYAREFTGDTTTANSFYVL